MLMNNNIELGHIHTYVQHNNNQTTSYREHIIIVSVSCYGDCHSDEYESSIDRPAQKNHVIIMLISKHR